jgi:hypothetical protein
MAMRFIKCVCDEDLALPEPDVGWPEYAIPMEDGE